MGRDGGGLRLWAEVEVGEGYRQRWRWVWAEVEVGQGYGQR